MYRRFAIGTFVTFCIACGGAEPPGSQTASSVEEPVLILVGEDGSSTDRNETFPAQDPTDGSLWFSVYENSFGNQTIMFAAQTESGWADPSVASFSGEWGDRAPRFSPDGSALYFTSNRPRNPGESAGDMNIWRVERSEVGWSAPALVDAPLNSSDDDIHACVTNAAIWTASNRDGGRGRSDIYRVGDDGSVQHLPAHINDELSQPDLLVSPDESWMILAITDHPEGLGGDDLYLSRFDGDSWSAPENLGPEINSPEYEYGPTISADGDYLFFTSHRTGSADIFRISLTAALNKSS